MSLSVMPYMFFLLGETKWFFRGYPFMSAEYGECCGNNFFACASQGCLLQARNFLISRCCCVLNSASLRLGWNMNRIDRTVRLIT